MKSTSVLAWHWVGDTLRDGRPVPPDGELLRFDGQFRICRSGLHASLDPFDALQYAPGPILCRVRCSGIGAQEQDKFVCSERTILSRRDMTEPLRFFARMQALSVIDYWAEEPPQVVLDWLMTGGGSLREAAQSAAWSAWAAASAWSVARSAAYSTAESTYPEAYSAAYLAAWSATVAARAAGFAESAARSEFNQLVKECFE